MTARSLSAINVATVLLAGCAPSPPAPSAPQVTHRIRMLAPSRFAARTDTFLDLNEGHLPDTDFVVYVVGSDSLIDSINAPGQHAVVVFDLHSGINTTVTDSMKEEIVHLNYSSNEMRGLRVSLDDRGRRDSVGLSYQLPPGTFDRRSLALVLQLVPLTSGASLFFPMFDSWSQHVATVGVAVDGSTSVRVPAGTFSAYRLDVRGQLIILPRVYYVTTTLPRRILRVEQGRRTWELINHRLQ